MLTLPPALAAFNQYPKFIVYKLAPSKSRPGKTDKLPVNHATARIEDAHDPAIWTDFQTASLAAQLFGAEYGVGYVFTADDPFWFLDIDGCLDDTTGTWSPLALQLCQQLAGTAIEVSSSGKGLHLFGSGTLPAHATKNEPLHIELYDKRRFVALTGVGAVGDAGFVVADSVLSQLVADKFPPRDAASNELEEDWWSTEPVADWNGPEDDVVLLERMFRSASAAALLGGRARFVDLWDADAAALAVAYPPPTDSTAAWNESVADAALAQHLAFWTGNNAQRMCDLMFKSGLQRQKWHDRWPYYIKTTIRNACAMQTEWLHDAPPAPPPLIGVPTADGESGVALSAAQAIIGSTYLSPDQQVTYFAGCTYVQEQHRVLLPNGTLVKPEQFKAIYGGRNFVMDPGNERTVRNAFEAFTESQAYTFPRADKTCFRPKVPFGQLVVEGGLRLVNTYLPISVPRAVGDPSKFLQHLARILPDARDQSIVLGYLAGCVQLQGTKFQWAPLIQGVEGNGKSLLFKCVARAIGKRYVHWPLAQDIDNSFNAWLAGHTFFAVDEIYIADKRIDAMETLKPMITGDEGIQITKKGVDATSQDICGNFGFLTNHQDGMRSSRNDRRVAQFFCAQQFVEDLAATGLTPGYFIDLVDWLKGAGAYEGQPPGYDIVSEFLWSYEIPDEFNPALMVRKPVTSTAEQAIEMGLGNIEQTINEAIAQQEMFFKGGWVSSTGLKEVMAKVGSRLPLSKYRPMMRALGYDWHPALREGRAGSVVVTDGNRPQLFLRREHPARLLTGHDDIIAAYTSSQLAT